MRNKILRTYDSQRRINVPLELLEFVGIKPNTEIAVCSWEHDCVILRAQDNVTDCEIVALAKMDSKGRFCYPKCLVDPEVNEEVFEIFVKNGNLCLKDAGI